MFPPPTKRGSLSAAPRDDLATRSARAQSPGLGFLPGDTGADREALRTIGNRSTVAAQLGHDFATLVCALPQRLYLRLARCRLADRVTKAFGGAMVGNGAVVNLGSLARPFRRTYVHGRGCDQDA